MHRVLPNTQNKTTDINLNFWTKATYLWKTKICGARVGGQQCEEECQKKNDTTLQLHFMDLINKG